MGSTSAGNRTLCMDTKHIFSNSEFMDFAFCMINIFSKLLEKKNILRHLDGKGLGEFHKSDLASVN